MAGCAVSRYGNGNKKGPHLDAGSAYPSHAMPFAHEMPPVLAVRGGYYIVDGCLPQPHAELRNRLVVAAYLRAHTQDG